MRAESATMSNSANASSSEAVLVWVVGGDDLVGLDDSVDDVLELQLDRRHVVDPAHDHVQQMLGALAPSSATRAASAPRARQCREPSRPHLQQRAHDGGDEDLAATWGSR